MTNNQNATRYSSEESFHKIIIEIIPELLEMMREIRKLQNSSAKFNSIVLPPWHHYYEMPLWKVILSAMTSTDSLNELLDIFSSEDLYERTHQLINPNPPYMGSKQPDNISSKQLAPILALLFNFESVLYNKKFLNGIMYDIHKNGDPNGSKTKQILGIDRTAIHCETISKKLQDAQFVKNEDYLKAISNAFPIKNKAEIRYPELTFAIFLLLDSDMFDSMSEEKREELLKPYYADYKEPKSFHRECNRIRNTFRHKNRKNVSVN